MHVFPRNQVPRWPEYVGTDDVAAVYSFLHILHSRRTGQTETHCPLGHGVILCLYNTHIPDQVGGSTESSLVNLLTDQPAQCYFGRVHAQIYTKFLELQPQAIAHVLWALLPRSA